MGDGDEHERQEAFAAAVGALRRRERPVAEMHTWLGDRGVPEAMAAAVLSDLIGVGELDDDRFAHAFAADKRELAGWGPERIEATLVDRGLERSLAELASREDPDLQLTRAVGLLVERRGPPRDESERSRALAFLTRRGYEYELAYEAIRRAEREGEAAA